VDLPPGGGAAAWVCANGSNNTAACPAFSTLLPALGCAANGTDCMLISTLTYANGGVVDVNEQLLTTPGALALPRADVSFVIGQPSPDGSSVPITLTSTGVALYVNLVSMAQGRFSANAFALLPGAANAVTVNYLPFGACDYGTLTSTLRVEHLAAYIA
jgi:hypothetical protein